MGEASRRGTRAARQEKPLGRRRMTIPIPEAARRAFRKATGKNTYSKRISKFSKRERARRKRIIKREFGYTRRDVSMIGAGHVHATDAYVDALIDAEI